MTANTTPDERILRAAANANPADAHARLLLADELQTQGRDREAAVERVVAQPWCDEWRLQLADVAERQGNPEYAEFVRVQVELGRFPEEEKGTGFIAACKGDYEARAVRDVNPARERLQRRLVELSGRKYEAAFRRGPKCGACDGIGYGAAGLGGRADGARCVHCDGTGDAGGLGEWFPNRDPRANVVESDRWRHRADWVRGCPERVKCRLGELIEPVYVCGCGAEHVTDLGTCTGCMGRGREKARTEWRVTGWAKRVVRWHAVLELWPVDRQPYWNGGAYCFYNTDRVRPSNEVPESAQLPPAVFALVRKPGSTSSDRLSGFGTVEAARTALATALARLARGSLPEAV